jgi:signal transduction histidine kinase
MIPMRDAIHWVPQWYRIHMPEDITPDPPEQPWIADYLTTNREGILAEWMDAVRDDDQIPSADRLTMTALKDHFPEMLTEIGTSLREPIDEKGSNEARKTGREHGKGRWRNGYRLDEVLRELARVREIILAYVKNCPGNSGAEAGRDAAMSKVRFFFDTIVATSARQFTHEQEGEVNLRSRQLENAYEQVQAATDQLRDIAESRLRLMRAVSHELRNALQSLGFAAQALLDETDLENRAAVATRLNRSALRLQSLLDCLRQYSGILAGEARVKIEKVKLDRLLSDLEVRHRTAAKDKGLQLECRILAQFATVVSDGEKLQQIGENLLSNAIQHTDEGFVRVDCIDGGPDRWILRVTDSGSGIDATSARQVFSEFHGGRQSGREGIGLGLVITRHLAHLLGGEITFQSRVGDGTKFEVNLPREAVFLDGGGSSAAGEVER